MWINAEKDGTIIGTINVLRVILDKNDRVFSGSPLTTDFLGFGPRSKYNRRTPISQAWERLKFNSWDAYYTFSTYLLSVLGLLPRRSSRFEDQ